VYHANHDVGECASLCLFLPAIRIVLMWRPLQLGALQEHVYHCFPNYKFTLYFFDSEQKGLKLLSSQVDLDQAQAIHDSQPHTTNMRIILSPEIPSPGRRLSPPYPSPTSSPHEHSPPSPTPHVSVCRV